MPLLTAACLLGSLALSWHYIGSSNLLPRQGRIVQPLGNGDYALQYYYATLGSRFLHETGEPYGYDPRFLSGYVKTPIYYPSSLPLEFALEVLSPLPPALAFNWTIFLLLAATPFLIYLAAANFGLDPAERLVVLLLALVPPQSLEPNLGLVAIMKAAGMISFVFASYLSIFTVSLAYRFLVRGSWSSVLPLGLAAPLLFPFHPTTPVITAVPLALVYLRTLRRLTLRQHVALWAVGALAVAALWPWIHGYLLFGHYSDLTAFDHADAKGHFSMANGSILGPLGSYLSSPSVVSRIPIVLGGLGLLAWWKAGTTDRLVVVGGSAFYLAAVAYGGSNLGLAATAPGRFALPLALYLFLAASTAVVRFVRIAAEEARRIPLTSAQRWLAVAAALLVLPDVVDFAMPRNLRTLSTLPEMQMHSGYTSGRDEFMDWLETNTKAEHRILHEETSRFSYQYYGTYAAALFPLRMDRSFANGPAPYPLLKQNVLRFMAGQLQERPLEDVEPKEMTALLDRYNIGWVLCWSDECKSWFSAQPGVAEQTAEFEKFVLFRTLGERSFFLTGSGELETGPNRITIKKAVPVDDTLVLRYHWDEHLRAAPPAELFPFEVEGDPVPFVGVRHPPATVHIRFEY